MCSEEQETSEMPSESMHTADQEQLQLPIALSDLESPHSDLTSPPPILHVLSQAGDHPVQTADSKPAVVIRSIDK